MNNTEVNLLFVKYNYGEESYNKLKQYLSELPGKSIKLQADEKNEIISALQPVIHVLDKHGILYYDLLERAFSECEITL